MGTMMMFKKLDNYLIDIEDSSVIDTSRGVIFRFDFDEMTVRKVVSTTKGGGTPTPVKYSESAGGLVMWKSSKWMSFGDFDEAVQDLFNLKVEHTVLG